MKTKTTQMWLTTFLLSAILLLASFSSSESSNKISQINSVMKCCSPAGNYKELIIKVNEINEKNFYEVRTAIEAGGGVIYKGYCPGSQVLMYLVNRDVHPDNTFLNKLSALSYTYQIKEGTITQVCADCGIEPVISETE